MPNSQYILERFRYAEDCPEATEDTFLNFLNNMINSSANNEEEAQDVLLDYLDFLNVSSNLLKINYKNGHFEVDFID